MYDKNSEDENSPIDTVFTILLCNGMSDDERVKYISLLRLFYYICIYFPAMDCRIASS